MINGPKQCWNLKDSTFTIFSYHCQSKKLEKVSLSDLQNDKTVFNTLPADDKYCLCYRDNLTEPIEIHLSKNQKCLSKIFSSFLKYTLKFEHFEIKDDPRSVWISKITANDVMRQMSRKSRFRRPFNKRHCKPLQILLKFQLQPLHHIY